MENNKIKVGISRIQEFLYNSVERANKLYHILFLEKYIINRKEDAEGYIRLINEYEHIVDILRELQIYNWLNVELDNRNDIEVL